MLIAARCGPPARRQIRLLALALLMGVAALTMGGLAPGVWVAQPPPEGRPAPGEILAAFHSPPSPRMLAPLGLTRIEHSPTANVTRLRVSDRDLDAALARLRGSGLTAWAEPNGRLRVAQLRPSDPRYGEQAPIWNLLGAPDAWAITTGSREVVVAVLDGGVDLDHPDLAANIWTNPGEIPGNGVDDDGNGYVDDVHGYDFVGDFPGGEGSPGEDNNPDVFAGDPAAGDGLDQDENGAADSDVGHGTRVAGIIAARGGDGQGVAGMAWRVRIMPVRVTDPEGSGFYSSFVRGMEYAAANGADVINISLVATLLPEAAKAAVRAAAAAGVIMVAAGGNDGGLVSFPAAMPEVIAVGSHGSGDEVDARAPFSPRWPGVDLVVPGTSILTTDVQAESASPSFAWTTGSSYSAALVTGAVALALSLEPGLDRAAVLQLLTDTATPLPDGAEPDWDGAGRLNIGAAIERLRAAPPGAPMLHGIEIEAPQGDFILRGLARPDSRIDLLVSPGETRASAPTDAEGRFRIALPAADVAERLASLTLTAWTVVTDADAAERVSAAAGPATFALPRPVLLAPGWNLVAWAGATGRGADVLADLPAAVERVFAWDAQGWRLAVPGDARFQIDRIAAGTGLWVFLGGAEPVVWLQDRSPIPARTLMPGWHLLAQVGDADAADLSAFAAGRAKVFLWEGAAAGLDAFTQAPPGLDALQALRLLDPVWLLVADGELVWPGS